MIKTIDRFQAFFIHSCDIREDRPRPIEGTSFLDQMIEVFRDEFSDEFIARTERKTLFSGLGLYDNREINIEVYESVFHDFGCSIIYTRLFGSQPIDIGAFAILCSGNKYMDLVQCDEGTVKEIMAKLGVTSRSPENAFLILQIQAASPDYPRDDNRASDIRQHFDGTIEQLLLRSDTDPADLRPFNHSATHQNISNFHGSVDLCSKNTLIQIYQRPVSNLFDRNLVITEDYRVCWWLALTDILHLQKSVLYRSEKRVDLLDFDTGRHLVHQIDEIDNIVRDMKRYWSLGEMTHPMSRVLASNLRSRMGLDENLRRVYDKLETFERIVTRNLDQSRNRQATLLNYLILLLAAIEMFPLIREGVYIALSSLGFQVEPPVVFVTSAGVGFVLPIALFAYVGTLRRRSRRTSPTR